MFPIHFRMARSCIQMLQVCFEWFEFALESLSNASTPFRIVRICIQMLWLWFEWLAFAFYFTLPNHSSTSLYFTLPWLFFALLDSTVLYITLPWLYFTQLTSTLDYHGSTSLYVTPHYSNIA